MNQLQSVNIRFLHLNSITKLLSEELKKTKASVISNEAFFKAVCHSITENNLCNIIISITVTLTIRFYFHF